MVRISHSRIAAAMASGPAVKFRFTGHMACQRHADVDQRAGCRRGQQDADHLAGAGWSRTQRLSRTAAVSARP